jgi:hypothetical protein
MNIGKADKKKYAELALLSLQARIATTTITRKVESGDWMMTGVLFSKMVETLRSEHYRADWVGLRHRHNYFEALYNADGSSCEFL